MTNHNSEIKPQKNGSMEEKTAYLFLIESSDSDANDVIKRINQHTDKKFMRTQGKG